MERRVLLAIALSILVLVVWQGLFAPPPEPPPSGAPEDVASTPVPEVGSGAPEEVPAAGRPVAAAPAESSGRGATVRTPLFDAAFGAGGGVTAWQLRYRGEKPLALGEAIQPLAVALTRPGRPPELPVLEPRRRRIELGPDAPAGELTLAGTGGDGLRVTQTLGFRADSYEVDVTLRVESTGPEAEAMTLALYWTGAVAIPGAEPEAAWVTFAEGPDHRQVLGRILVAQDGGATALEHPAPTLKDPTAPPAEAELAEAALVAPAVLPPGPRWVALENDYYIAALVPSGEARVLRGRERDLAEVGVVFPEVTVGPGRVWEGHVIAYVGPKAWDRLAALGVGLEQAQARNYGAFLGSWSPIKMWWFCVPLLWLLNLFATYVPGQNYGVAIILVTVVVKVLFYPLTHKSMTSMKKMQALQPQINALRSKYKGDPQRQQREQMALFRTHKVNPMGGCLPMVVQMPVFYALYLTLQYSVELQGAPFLLWIMDLSKKDPYYVLPILMGASMFVQQKMTPTSVDPRQAKIMLFMPVMFTVFFLEFPTGLVLYWLMNNLLSIGQQRLIDRAAARAKAALPVAAKPPKRERKAQSQ